MYTYDRKEAGVFLIGLLLTCGDNWEKRRAIATALYDVQTEGCVNVLVGELKRVKNKNYLFLTYFRSLGGGFDVRLSRIQVIDMCL